MHNLARGLVLVSALAAGCTSSEPCPCHCPADLLVLGPEAVGLDGRPVYPPNVRLMLQLARFDASSVTLEDEVGADVPFALVPANDAAGVAAWLVPDAPLPSGHYTLAASRTDRGAQSYTLEVVGEPDTTPPAVADFAIGGLVGDGHVCGATTGGWVSHRTDYVVGTGDGGRWVHDERVLFEVTLDRAGVTLGTAFTTRELTPLGGTLGEQAAHRAAQTEIGSQAASTRNLGVICAARIAPPMSRCAS